VAVLSFCTRQNRRVERGFREVCQEVCSACSSTCTMWRCGVAAVVALCATCCAAARYQGVLHLPGAQPNPEPPSYPASFEACPAPHPCTLLRASLTLLEKMACVQRAWGHCLLPGPMGSLRDWMSMRMAAAAAAAPNVWCSVGCVQLQLAVRGQRAKGWADIPGPRLEGRPSWPDAHRHLRRCQPAVSLEGAHRLLLLRSAPAVAWRAHCGYVQRV
jgi:hypothetical protein